MVRSLQYVSQWWSKPFLNKHCRDDVFSLTGACQDPNAWYDAESSKRRRSCLLLRPSLKSAVWRSLCELHFSLFVAKVNLSVWLCRTAGAMLMPRSTSTSMSTTYWYFIVLCHIWSVDIWYFSFYCKWFFRLYDSKVWLLWLFAPQFAAVSVLEMDTDALLVLLRIFI